MKIIVLIIFLLLFLPVSGPAVSSSSYENDPDFRCGNLIVREGDHSFLVMKHCGEPVFKEIYGPADYSESLYDRLFIEKWVYGPEAGYYYILYFKVGVLFDLEAYRVIW